MLDEAYICEASIEACGKLKEKLWRELIDTDITSAKGLWLGLKINQLENLRVHCMIMLACHGGE